MLAPIGFLIAGFFWPVWPGGIIAACVVQAFVMLTSIDQYRLWYRQRRAALPQLLATQIVLGLGIHSALMLPGNFIRWLL